MCVCVCGTLYHKDELLFEIFIMIRVTNGLIGSTVGNKFQILNSTHSYIPISHHSSNGSSLSFKALDAFLATYGYIRKDLVYTETQ